MPAPDAAPDAPDTSADSMDMAPDGLVVLLLIDTSESIRGHQGAAVSAVLATLRDELRDVTLPVHVGVLSSFMTSPGVGTVEDTCADGTGGRLLTRSDPGRPGCIDGDVPPWHRVNPEDPADAILQVACVAHRLETCPVEQPIESLAMALGRPSDRFGTRGEPGQDVLASLPLERPFVVVFAFAPEDDCSTQDPTLQTRGDVDVAPDERCALFADSLGPVDRHVDAILRSVPPQRLALYFLGGIPPGASGRPVEDLAADPRITPTFDPGGRRLQVTCRAPSPGIATYPPDRQLDFLAAMAERGVLAADMGTLCVDYAEELRRMTEGLFVMHR